MTLENKITKWLLNNIELNWRKRTSDESNSATEGQIMNRKRGYELRDFLISYYDKCKLEHTYENYRISLIKILNYKRGEEITSKELLDHLMNK